MKGQSKEGRSPIVIVGGTLLLLAAVGLLAWNLFGKSSTAGDVPLKPAALCSACGFYQEGKLDLKAGSDRAARAPAFGPGYLCPKCGKYTFYVNPFVCPKCNTRYLMRAGRPGEILTNCPKCGFEG